MLLFALLAALALVLGAIWVTDFRGASLIAAFHGVYLNPSSAQVAG